MIGLKVILHALGMLWENRGVALRIALVPSLLMIGASALLNPGDAPFWSMAHAKPFESVLFDAFASEEAFALMIVWVLATTWMFVAWHRFILLGDRPGGWLPPLRRVETIAYIIAAAKLLGIGAAVLVVMVLLAAVTGIQSPWPLTLGILMLGYVLYRMAAVLPAAATGRKMGLAEAVGATAGAGVAIWIAMGFRYVCGLVVDMSVAGAADINGGLGLMLFAALTLFMSLVNASILTTIYGHWVEGWPLHTK